MKIEFGKDYDSNAKKNTCKRKKGNCYLDAIKIHDITRKVSKFV